MDITHQVNTVAVVMGSRSDWETMKHSVETLNQLNIPHYVEVISAHRTPDRLFEFAEQARAKGFAAIIAGAGGAAHLPGMLAAKTSLPIFGVPVASKQLQGVDSLLSIVQMPAGIPVASLAIGRAGAINAALLAAACMSVYDPKILAALERYRQAQTAEVLAAGLGVELGEASCASVF